MNQALIRFLQVFRALTSLTPSSCPPASPLSLPGVPPRSASRCRFLSTTSGNRRKWTFAARYFSFLSFIPDPRATTPLSALSPENPLQFPFPRFLTPAFDSIRLGIETSSGQNSLMIPAIPLLPQNSLHFSPAPLAQVYSPQPAAAPPTLHILESAIPDNPVETSLPQKPLFFSTPPIHSIPAVPTIPLVPAVPVTAPTSPSSSYVGSPALEEAVGTWRENEG